MEFRSRVQKSVNFPASGAWQSISDRVLVISAASVTGSPLSTSTTCINLSIHTYKCRPTYLHTYTYIYIPTYLLTYLPTYLPAYLPTSMHASMHACMHACIYTCTYTFVYACICWICKIHTYRSTIVYPVGVLRH